MLLKIKKKIDDTLEPQHLEVIDESHKHLQKKEGVSHLKLIVVCKQFTPMSPLQRHRMIHELLKEEISSLHALSLHLFSPTEWEKQTFRTNTPACIKENQKHFTKQS